MKSITKKNRANKTVLQLDSPWRGRTLLLVDTSSTSSGMSPLSFPKRSSDRLVYDERNKMPDAGIPHNTHGLQILR